MLFLTGTLQLLISCAACSPQFFRDPKGTRACTRERLFQNLRFEEISTLLSSEAFSIVYRSQNLSVNVNRPDHHGRIARWLSFMADYQFNIAFRAGRNIGYADFCSRPFNVSSPNPFDFCVADSSVAGIQVQESLQHVIPYLMGLGHNTPAHNYGKSIRVQAKNYMVLREKLFQMTLKGLRFVPDIDICSKILAELHDENGHWDFNATYQMVSERYSLHR